MEERLANIDGVIIRNNENKGADGVGFVFIPADDDSSSSSSQELLLTLPKNNVSSGGDPFLSLLAPYFRLRPGETVDPDSIQNDAIAAREAGCATGMCPHVSPLTLRRAAEEGTLERVKLFEDKNTSESGTATTTVIIIYMYYDDSAHLKQRPINQWATKYSRDKNDGATIYGDVFLAKMSMSNAELQPIPLDFEALQKEPWFVDSSH
jgi:hypothetical protein